MKLAIFDLDGTLSPQRPYSTAPFQRILLPAVAARLSVLREQGVFLAVATNQGGASLQRSRRITIGAVQAHLRWLRRELGLHAVRFAIVTARKKPNPAMLIELMTQFNVTPEATIFVGDMETDRRAAVAARIPFIYAETFFRDREVFNVCKHSQFATCGSDCPNCSTSLAALPGYLS